MGRVDAARLERHRAGTHSGEADLEALWTGRGRLVVALGDQDPGEEASRPYQVHVSSKPRGGRFGSRKTLDRGGPRERPVGAMQLDETREGRLVLAWGGVHFAADGRTPAYPIVYSLAGLSARFGAPRTLVEGGALGGLEPLPGGGAIAAWVPWAFEPPGAFPVQAAILPRGAAVFGTPETVTPAGEDGGVPRLVVDRRRGRPTLLGSGRAGSSARPGCSRRCRHRAGSWRA